MEVIMAHYQSYYCYLNKGIPTVKEDKPKDFTDLPYHYTTYCPSGEVAKIIYQANLKIMKLRED
jgi:hypothetical protein